LNTADGVPIKKGMILHWRNREELRSGEVLSDPCNVGIGYQQMVCCPVQGPGKRFHAYNEKLYFSTKAALAQNVLERVERDIAALQGKLKERKRKRAELRRLLAQEARKNA